ncbi:MAG: hypothetical protein ACRC5M_04425 [Anaeroplasmataceae bacterium]
MIKKEEKLFDAKGYGDYKISDESLESVAGIIADQIECEINQVEDGGCTVSNSEILGEIIKIRSSDFVIDFIIVKLLELIYEDRNGPDYECIPLNECAMNCNETLTILSSYHLKTFEKKCDILDIDMILFEDLFTQDREKEDLFELVARRMYKTMSIKLSIDADLIMYSFK